MTDVEKQIRKVIESFPNKNNIDDLTLVIEQKWSGGDEMTFPLFVTEDRIEVLAGTWTPLSKFMQDSDNPKVIGVMVTYAILKRLEDV